MEKKIEIVTEMVSLGYCLFGESIESFAGRWSEEVLQQGLASFKKYKGLN